MRAPVHIQQFRERSRDERNVVVAGTSVAIFGTPIDQLQTAVSDILLTLKELFGLFSGNLVRSSIDVMPATLIYLGWS